MSRVLSPWLLTLALVLAGCDQTPVVSDCVPGVDPSCETPGGTEIVAGVNLTALFAAPAAAEVEAARPPVPATRAVTTVTVLQPFDGARSVLITLDRGGERLLSALARVPGGADQTTLLPVVVVLPDGTDGASQDDYLTDPSFGHLVDGVIQVVVAYRGESLAVPGRADAPSTVPADPYRADVADLLKVLDLLIDVPRADIRRIGVVGVGRGGTVGLLAALQGAPIRSLVTLGAPTDLFTRSFRAEVRAELLGSPLVEPYPAFDALAAPALGVRDGLLTPEAARLGLLEVSPARLAAGRTLPAVLALHASGDAVVGDDQLASLAAVLRSTEDTPRVATLVEDVTHESLLRAPSVQSQIAAFFDTTL